MIDVSDGLALDLHRLADTSGVGFELDDVPVAAGATLERRSAAARTTSCSSTVGDVEAGQGLRGGGGLPWWSARP